MPEDQVTIVIVAERVDEPEGIHSESLLRVGIEVDNKLREEREERMIVTEGLKQFGSGEIECLRE